MGRQEVKRRADEQQVGGSHYKDLAITPWEIFDADFTAEEAGGFYRGSLLSYVLRYKAKGGVEDLKKARHYLDKLIEHEEGGL